MDNLPRTLLIVWATPLLLVLALSPSARAVTAEEAAALQRGGFDTQPIPAALSEGRELILRGLMGELLKTHDGIKASVEAVESARRKAQVFEAKWLPQVDLSVEAGHEDVDSPGLTSSKYRNIQSATLTQVLYDFGSIKGDVGFYTAMYFEARTKLEQTRQNVLQEGLTAWLGLVRAREVLKYAMRSEENIKTLSGMQEALVRRGAGLSYEELQIKAQLAGAQATRVAAERGLDAAKNRFKAVFNFPIDDARIERMYMLPLPVILPVNLDTSIEQAMKENPYLIELEYTVLRNEGALEKAQSAFYPKLDFVGEAKRKEQDQGADGVRNEGRLTVKMTYNLFSGGADVQNVASVNADIRTTRQTILDRRRTIEEGVRNAWQSLTTQRVIAEHYANQANITWEFLELVKRKKATGEEVNLLDILVGERDYVAATSAAVTAEIDTVAAAYALLHQMGRMNLDVISE